MTLEKLLVPIVTYRIIIDDAIETFYLIQITNEFSEFPGFHSFYTFTRY